MASRTTAGDDQQVSPQEIERVLNRLTDRQRRELCWLCKEDLQNTEIAVRLNLSENTVNNDISAIYKDLRITDWDKNRKRAFLKDVICPAFLDQFAMDADCRKVQPRARAQPAAAGPVIDGEGVAREEPVTYQAGRRPEEPGGETRTQEPSSGPRQPVLPWNWIIPVLALFAILCLGSGFLIGIFYAGRTSQLGPIAASTIVTVPVPQTVMVPQTVVLPQTVIVTVTPYPSTPPGATSEATVPPTAAPSSTPTIPNPPTAVPETAKSANCTPRSGTVNLSGKVASDIPGTPICLGETVSSVVDNNTKPSDLYAIALAAGQEVRFQSNSGSGCLFIHLYNPNSKSLETNQVSEAWNDYICGERADDYMPAVSGTYYVAIVARGSGVSYSLSTKPTAFTVPGDHVANDIPGTKIAVGASVSSVVDNNTKPNDVYAIDLAAGQAVRFKVSTNGCLFFHLYNPGSKSVETNQVSEAFSDYICGDRTDDYSPAVSGTYYATIVARGTGVTYTLSSTPLK